MDEDLLAAVREAAEEEDMTLSAFLAEAARARVHLLVMDRVLDEWEQENGPFTEEELREGDEWFEEIVTPEQMLQEAGVSATDSAGRSA
jgi:hypothetical protein